MQWYPAPAGVFDSAKCAEVGDRLCRAILVWTGRAPTSGLDSAREAHFADLMDLHSACFKNEGEDADEALARMRGLLKERRAALSDMKGKPPHYGPGSGERPQGGIPVQDGG
jgi:hypothetical protein